MYIFFSLPIHASMDPKSVWVYVISTGRWYWSYISSIVICTIFFQRGISRVTVSWLVIKVWMRMKKSLKEIPKIKLHHRQADKKLANAMGSLSFLGSLNCAINKNERNRDIFYDGRFNCSLTRFISKAVFISLAHILNKQIWFISRAAFQAFN